MLRVIAGTKKGLLLSTPEQSARPLTDRIRTSLFDLLAEYIPESKILDIFAGSGSFGFEALSRGAAEATFVDASQDSFSALHKNAKKFSEYKVRILRLPAERFLAKTDQKYTIVFLDPPFPMSESEMIKTAELAVKTLADEAILVLRMPEERRMPKILASGDLTAELVHEKRMGKSRIGFYRN